MSSPVETQTAATGQSRQQELMDRYVPKGSKAEDQPRSAEEAVIAFLARNGGGKSYFLQSHPRLAIVNCQMTPTTHPSPVAELWPRESGEPLTWPEIMDFITYVVTSKLAGKKDAPTGIGIDSYVELLQIARQYAAYQLYERKCVKDGVTPKPLTQFDAFDIMNQNGESVWDLAYTRIRALIRACRCAFVGLYFAVPLVDMIVEIGKGNDKEITERLQPPLSRSGTQFSLLRDPADAILFMNKEDTTKTETVVKRLQLRGREVERPESISTPAVRQTIHTKYDLLRRFLKVRSSKLRLPEVIDVSETGWSGFAKVWDEAAGVKQ